MKRIIIPNSIIPLLIGNKKPDYYHNQLIKADTGLHGQIYDIVQELCPDKTINILDIACGDGALASRLYDGGYQNIVAADLLSHSPNVASKYSFSQLDLNDYQGFLQFTSNNIDRFDLILGIETIEHLENPWNYIRNLTKMLKKTGTLIISTPNIESIYSKVYFILKNRFFQFSESDLSYWHINPIASYEMEIITTNLNLVITRKYAGGMYPIIWINRDFQFSLIYSFFNLLLYPFCNEERYGWCQIFVIHKQS